MALPLLLLLVGARGPGPFGRMQSERAPQHTTDVVVNVGILILVGAGRKAPSDLPTWRITHPRHLALHRGWEPRQLHTNMSAGVAILVQPRDFNTRHFVFLDHGPPDLGPDP